MATEPIFVVFTQQKNRALTSDDDFFRKVEKDRKKYFDANLSYITNFLTSKGYSSDTKIDLLKYLSVLFLAQDLGYMDVNWERLFAIRKPENFLEVVTTRYDYVKRAFPVVTKTWDKAVKNQSNNEMTK